MLFEHRLEERMNRAAEVNPVDHELEDELERELDGAPEPQEGDLDAQDPGENNGEAVEGQGEAPEQGLPTDSGYTISMAKSQLDGITKQFPKLSVQFPEGDKRHKFIEIGERLSEISAVLARDFINGGTNE